MVLTDVQPLSTAVPGILSPEPISVNRRGAKNKPAAPPPALKPPLKWAGGKRWLVNTVRAYWENFRDRRYIEPFCGGLALPLGLLPQNALLNDMNKHVINFYQQVQRGLNFSLSDGNDADIYYQRRQQFNDLIRDQQDTSAESAQLFYFLNRTGYNGLCRFNQHGEFNVPFGKYKKITYLPHFYDYQPVLGSWTFTHGDFEDVPLRSGDFVYADPPYDVPFVHYSKFGFSWDDQQRLAAWLATHDGPVIISNQATERVKDLYHKYDYTLIEMDAPRRISCNGDRKPAREVLAFRNIPVRQADC